MEKIIHYCDLCNQSIDKEKLKKYRSSYSFHDLCESCVNKLVKLCIDSRDFQFRAYCNKCNGSGKLEEKEDLGDHLLVIKNDCDCGLK